MVTTPGRFDLAEALHANLQAAGIQASAAVIDSLDLGDSGYDAVQDRGRRRPPRSRITHEDHVLRAESRQKLIATNQDLQRNFAIAAWAVRKHLDYVSAFRFNCNTGDDRIDQQVEALIEEASRKDQFDIRKRHRLRRFIRIAEGRRCVDGDVHFLKLASGHLQAIEGDKIRNPRYGAPGDLNLQDFVLGIRTEKRTGEIKAYIVCDRDRKGGPYIYRSVVPARHMLSLWITDRFDQVRGISPIAAAINTFRDVYENFDYALAKAKVAQLFGLVITSKELDAAGIMTGQENEDGGEDPPYDVDFGRGPFKLEMEPGDDAKVLQDQTPSTQFREFTQVMIAVALKSLDIPFSFFDESFTNFYGSRGGLMQYLKSCESKREDLQELLGEWTAWRLALYGLDGRLKLPEGMTVADLKWEWVPDGVPWWDPAKEVRGHAMGVAAGFETFERVVREAGSGTGDVYENIRRNAEVLRYAKQQGFPLTLPGANAFNADAAVAVSSEQGGDDAQ